VSGTKKGAGRHCAEIAKYWNQDEWNEDAIKKNVFQELAPELRTGLRLMWISDLPLTGKDSEKKEEKVIEALHIRDAQYRPLERGYRHYRRAP